MIATFLVLGACRQAKPLPQSDWRPPAFEIATASGDTFRYPEDMKGPTIVLFWATWCPYCNALMPHLQSVIDEYDGQVTVLALNFKEDGDPVEFLTVRGFDFTLLPNAGEVAANWGVKGTPGLFLADKTGRVVFSRGAIPPEAFPRDEAEDYETLRHFQKAARRAPFWAAQLRKSLDQLLN